MDSSLTLVIFGITSNLAQIKLIPALYDISEKNLLPNTTHIIGVARAPQDESWIKNYFHQTLHLENKHHQHPISEDVLSKLNDKLNYMNGQLNDLNFFQELKQKITELGSTNTIFYLATYPDLYKDIFDNLKKVGLNEQTNGFTRVMIEKPIGEDLPSAQRLNKLLAEYFTEDQIYRLDHYLGKETLQNILTFRFGNGTFEPLINKDHIDHIQITASENFGIGKRGGYYDKVGALKDVGQNHQLQMLAFALMDPPSEFSNTAITKERTKILKNLQPIPEKVVFGQYEGYQQEENVEKDSKTDTFYALKTFINIERLKDVPIYIRAGKNLKETVTEISIIFKTPTNRLFQHIDCGKDPNVLIYRIQPNEGIVLKILTKKPGHTIDLDDSYMQFCYRSSNELPDAYEKLISDAIRGDQTFFNDAEEVEAQWKFIDPLVKTKTIPIVYSSKSWGPKEADDLIKEDSREWLEPSMMFCNI
jgi:glucose-6-phosphate 1-dehydrogenase